MVEVDGLTKVYGSRVAVWKVSFRVAKGEILGFLGPNGAGKTTTMRMITGFIPPSSGSATVAGYDVGASPMAVKSNIGYLCEMPPVYREMRVDDYLRFVAQIKKVPRARHRHLVERAIESCALQDVSRRVIGNLSKGFRQRVGLAQAILHEPKVLILDEPTSGLDPRQIIEIRERIRELGGEQTVVLSTHILPEVTATCTRVVVINEGQVVAEDSVENLTRGVQQRENLVLQVGRRVPGLVQRLTAVEGVEHVEPRDDERLHVRISGGTPVKERLAAAVVESGAGLVEMSKERATLEEVFLSLVTEEESAA